MAIEKVNLADATISINAKSNAAAVEVITCLVGELSFSKGEREFVTEACHTGESTGTGIKRYPEGEFTIIFDSSNTYGAQVMLEAALNHTGDFANDNTLEFEIEFNNKKTELGSGALMKTEMLIGSFTANITAQGDSKITCRYKQMTDYTLTAAA
ncbi:hypothetical protein PF327_10785 [Sulfurovum sp. XTW-4]|uniref:DUF3224 domain-containing protein n=1 Tax=Sulfurovum xiamenensis TaxID=3019066 RepID=A0ABT7QUI6_9BACT|nr:hypothetical protein [Sulfurovum xiamenensis]MDM5264680.1 hypothetical protein [Sulfurovum xiamenensis]